MVTVEAVNYIKNQLTKGLIREQIESALIASGWQMEDIQEAFRLADSGAPVTPVSEGGGELPGPIELLHEAWGIYKSLMWKFLRVDFLTIAVTIPFSAIAVIAVFLALLAVSLSGWTLVITVPVIFFFIILANVVSEWGEMSDIELIKDSGESIGAVEAFKRTKHLLFPFFWIQVLVGLLISLGIFSFGVLGILFAVWFAFAPFILFTEGERGMRALLKSREYVRGRFSAVFGRMLFIGGVASLFQSAIGILQLIGSQGANASYSSGISSVVVKGVSLVLELVGVFFIPIVITYVFVLYRHVRTVKGAFIFNPLRKQKILYVSLALLTPALLIILIILSFVLTALFPRSPQYQNSKVPVSVSPTLTPNSLTVQVFVYRDDNKNGKHDTDESGFPDAQMKIATPYGYESEYSPVNKDGYTSVVDNLGVYNRSKYGGNVTVDMLVPNGYELTTNNNPYKTTVSKGPHLVLIEFGLTARVSPTSVQSNQTSQNILSPTPFHFSYPPNAPLPEVDHSDSSGSASSIIVN